MMALLIPKASQKTILSLILNKEPAEMLTLKLYSNDLKPSQSDKSGTFTEVEGDGYTPIELTGDDWDISEKSGVTEAVCKGQEFSFTGQAGDVFGYFITMGPSLMWAERFPDGPYKIKNSGDTIKITPKLTLEGK